MRSPSLPLALLFWLGAALPSPAQDPGDIGIFFDEAATVTVAQQNGFTPFFWYVIGFDIETTGFEFSVAVPPELVVLQRTILGPPVLVIPPEGDNFLVGLGACYTGDLVLVRYNALYTVPVPPQDELLCIHPFPVSSFNPPAPGWVDCTDNLFPFTPFPDGQGLFPDGCAVLNPSQFPCPPFDRDAFVSVPDRQGDPGAQVEVPVEVSSPPEGIECAGLPPEVIRVEFTVEWDPAIATLVDVRDTSLSDGWTIGLLRPEPGTANVVMASPVIAIFDGFDPTPWARLAFDMTHQNGSTPVRVTAFQFTRENGEVVPVPSAVGTLTNGTVATRATSFGRLKARF